MKQLCEITFKHASDGEHVDLATVIANGLGEIHADYCKATMDFRNDIIISKEAFSDAIGRSRRNDLSIIITESDILRGDAREGIYDIATLYMNRSNPQYAAAGALIRSIYEKSYAGFNLSNNADESAGNARFLKNMGSAEAQEAAQVLRIEEDLETLESEDRRYNEKNTERAEIKENDDSPRLQPSRFELRRDIRAFESFINHKIRKGSEFHADIAAKLNGPISDIMDGVRARQTRLKNQEAAAE